MEFYNHLLDGENYRVASDPQKAELYNAIEKQFKIQTLFGYPTILNDVQLIDSWPIHQLFMNGEFLSFIRKNPRMLELRAIPEESLGNNTYSTVVKGLCRTKQEGWISSLYDNVDSIKRFADVFLSLGEDANEIKEQKPIPDELTAAIKKANEHDQRYLYTTLRILLFFLGGDAKNSPKVQQCSDAKISYYDVLKDIIDGNYKPDTENKLSDEMINTIHQIVKYVDDNIDPKQNHLRSLVRTSFGDEPWPEEKQIYWDTIVHAWNCAVENTIRPSGNITGKFNLGIPLSLYLNNPLNSLFEPDIKYSIGDKIKLSLSKPIKTVLGIPCDLGQLGWGQINQTVGKTSESRQNLIKYTYAEDDPAFEQLYDLHVRNLSEHLAETKLPISKITCFLTPAVPVLMAFGVPAVESIATGVGAGGFVEFLVRKCRPNWIASTIRRQYKQTFGKE